MPNTQAPDPDMDNVHWLLMRLSDTIYAHGMTVELHRAFGRVMDAVDAIIPGGCPDERDRPSDDGSDV